MNINVKIWPYKNLGGVFNKDILIQVLFKCLYYLELYRKIPAKIIEIYTIGKDESRDFCKRTKKWLHLHSMRSNNVLKVGIASIFVVIFMSVLGMSFSNAEKPIVNYVDIQVRSGDTVWTIAARNASKEEDIRELVYAIKAMNELNHNALIYPGQTLKVPTPNFDR